MGYVLQEGTLNTSLIVTNSSQLVLGAHGKAVRTAFVIRNIADDASKVITLNIGSGAAVANNGIVLKQGEVYYESTDAAVQCWQGEITAICAAASATATLAVFAR